MFQALRKTTVYLGAYKLIKAPCRSSKGLLKKEKQSQELLQLKAMYTSSTSPTFLISREGRPTDQKPSGSVWRTVLSNNTEMSSGM